MHPEGTAESVALATICKELNILWHLFNTARAAWGMESLANPVELVKGQQPKPPRPWTAASSITRKPAFWNTLRSKMAR